MKIGVDTLPPLPRDATDRNRTSPFAFTGNKFEFRAPGSSQSCSGPNTVLNTIVAESIDRISGELEKLSKEEFNSGLQHLLSRIISAHKRIIFNGNGYTDEWKKEAAKRGLPNAATTMEALRCLTGEENIAMFEKYHVYNRRELESRYEVFLEDYHNKIRIEGETALEIAGCMVQPAVAKEFAMLTGALADAETAGVSAGLAGLRKSAEELGTALDELSAKCDALKNALKGCHEEIIAAMNDLRNVVDKLKRIVPDANWPLPKYREMLFIY
ncbi:MAG: hypothetical protein V8T90_10080 [Victivallales bacterium]